MNPMHPAHRPATSLRTIVLIAGGILLAVLLLGSALAGGGGQESSDTSTDGCRTEFFDSGSISSCDGEILYTDDSGNGFSSGS